MPNFIVTMERVRNCLPNLKKPQKLIPDEGWCWVMFAAACIIMFLVFGVHYTFGILYPHLLQEFQKGEQKTAWIGSISSGLLILTSIVSVKLCEVTSVATTTLIGSLLSGSGLILTSFVKEFYALYFVYGVLFGIGTSFLYTPCLITIGRWFHKYQAATTGAICASAAFGAVVLSPLIQHVLKESGLRQTIRWCGVIYLTVVTLCSLCFKPIQYQSSNVQEVAKKSGEALIEAELLRKDEGKCDNEIISDDAEGNESSLFKNKSFLLYLVAMVITNVSYYVPILHLVNYSEHLGIPASKASFLISIWSISNIFGRLIYGKVTEHYRRHLLLIHLISMFCSAIVNFATYFADSYWMLCGYVILYGFLDGSYNGLLSLVTMDITGVKHFARGHGVMLTISGIPMAIGPAAIGAINDKKLLPPSFMFIAVGTSFIIGSALMNIIRKWKMREQKQLTANTDNNNSMTANTDNKNSNQLITKI